MTDHVLVDGVWYNVGNYTAPIKSLIFSVGSSDVKLDFNDSVLTVTVIKNGAEKNAVLKTIEVTK